MPYSILINSVQPCQSGNSLLFVIFMNMYHVYPIYIKDIYITYHMLRSVPITLGIRYLVLIVTLSCSTSILITPFYIWGN